MKPSLSREPEEPRKAALEKLRKEIGVGLSQADRGEVAPLNVARLKAEGRRRRRSR